MTVIDVQEKFTHFSKHWTPHTIADLNGQLVKLAKLSGDFLWHTHDDEDELFFVFKGVLFLELKNETVEIGPGQMYVVPKGVPHRPYTGDEEVHVMLFEPAATKHTGTVESDRTVTDLNWI